MRDLLFASDAQNLNYSRSSDFFTSSPSCRPRVRTFEHGTCWPSCRRRSGSHACCSSPMHSRYPTQTADPLTPLIRFDLQSLSGGVRDDSVRMECRGSAWTTILRSHEMHGSAGIPHHQTTPVPNDKGLHSPTLTRMVMKEYCHPELRTTPSRTSTRFERSEG